MSLDNPAPDVRRRLRASGHRQQRVNLRLSVDELAELAAAAAWVGEAPSGYAARSPWRSPAATRS